MSNAGIPRLARTLPPGTPSANPPVTTMALRRLAALVCLGAALSGCSGSAATAELPPTTLPELARIFEPELAPLGLHLTRAALVDGPYGSPSPTGRHLALYVEPTEPWPDSRYAESIVPLTRIFASSVFARWAKLESFDVCQEPPPGVDDRPEPAAVTKVDVERQGSAAVDWQQVDLVGLLVASGRGHVSVKVAPSVADEPTYHNALIAAHAALLGPA